ncbi:hypothetical protein ABPG75_006369 [Micractinium tetrahymenae]
MATRQFSAALLLVLAATAAAPPAVHALSWPLCEDGGQVWVTEAPHTEPGVIGANLWFFCETGLNVMGQAISPCILNGTVCDNRIPDALCQAFGFDRAVMEDVHFMQASPDEAVRELSGDYCVRNGTYSATLPEDLGSQPGSPCTKMQGLTCVRTRETIITALDKSLLEVFNPLPPSAEPVLPAGGPTLAASYESKLTPVEAAATTTTPADGAGNRRLRFF